MAELPRPPAPDPTSSSAPPGPLPRVTIRFCTQCKWMLRAAYFAQELLSTFSTALGEVALQPSTGGTFVVEIFYSSSPPSAATTTTNTTTATTTTSRVLWDRKTDGGFPETKELKRRVRDVIEPGRNLGHVDRDHHARPAGAAAAVAAAAAPASKIPAQAPASEKAPWEQQPLEQGKCEDCG
ncbi:seleno protein domain protein [Xylariaceae sp. FL0804]|nr:seleno protein domain protein [Xylariaceae sp. FL0804]